jgi:hypothetical protein
LVTRTAHNDGGARGKPDRTTRKAAVNITSSADGQSRR